MIERTIDPNEPRNTAMHSPGRCVNVHPERTGAKRRREMFRSRWSRWILPGVVLLWVAWHQAGHCAPADQFATKGSSSSTNLVRLIGNSFGDDTGPFLGLGVSYFQALRHARYDRALLNHNLELLAGKGFNYIRVLSMVSWDGLEIAPVTFTNRARRVIPAWPDYWSQFRDLLDLVARHGLRAEMTIFADAQYVMPSKTTRRAHLDGILANVAGRESHIQYLEWRSS
jgi:hypothetical protein